MRIFAATATLLVFAVLVSATSVSSAGANAGTSLAVGDQLVYQITVELQQHHVKGRDRARETAAQGTETFTIYAIGPDQTAYANVQSNFQGNDSGKAFESQTTSAAKVMRDGALRTSSRLGLGISEAIGFANTTTADMAQHTLHLGSGWSTPYDSPYVRLTLSRKVVGQTSYQGLTTYEVQSIGTGALLKTTDGAPATGTVAVSGTSYYDVADHLLIGEALRTLTVVQAPDNASAHDNYSATMYVVLSSWTHASAASSTASSPPGGSSQGAPTLGPPTPAPVPTEYAPTPYPTVTPRFGY